MQLAIGTAGLKPSFDNEYWKIFLYAIENGNYIHTSLKYENVEQYFIKADLENKKILKLIVKIEINRNPIKKILNLPNQINLILNKFKINFIDTIQICNNPSANKINMMILKKILNSYKKKGVIKNFFLESFEPFSDNLNKLINDNFFEGYIFKFNCLQRGTSKKFFTNIINSKKKIISISPLVGGNFFNVMNGFDDDLKKNIDYIMQENDLKNYNSLNIAFLKSIKNVKYGIFGTKKMDRLLNIESEINNIKPLNSDQINKILILQEKYKSIINY